MKLKVSEGIFEKFPGLNIGILSVKGINNKETNQEVIDLIRKEESRIKGNFDKATLAENPKIGAWRKAYSSFGAKPKKYKCSVENLYRMILDGIELKPINKIVDLYNYISIKHMIPVGGDNVDKIEGNIVLTLAKGGEKFEQLNSKEIKHPKEGEVVYQDDKEVLCRRWNWRECDKSKMTEDTENVTLVVEGLPPFTKEDIDKILDEMQELIMKFCGGEAKKFILDVNAKEAEF